MNNKDRSDPFKNCKTCKRGNEPLNVYCRACIEKKHINWEAIETMKQDEANEAWYEGIRGKEGKKVCETCKHEGLHSREEPCKSCIADDDTQDDKWEPRNQYTADEVRIMDKEWAEEQCKLCCYESDKGGKNCWGCNANKHREEPKMKQEKFVTNPTCKTCKHLNRIVCLPEYCDSSFSGYEAKETTVPYESHKTIKPPDYSFNQSIIDAIREGKIVWHTDSCGNWESIARHEITIGMITNTQWSLTKPVTRTKKTIERWVSDECISLLKHEKKIGVFVDYKKSTDYPNKINLSYEVTE